jgi:nicotinamide-nucleotide amidase
VIRAEQQTAATAEALVGLISDRHGDSVFSLDGSSIEEQVGRLLGGRRLAVGESCTGGLLAARLTERPGSSDHFAGGVVAYSNEAKVELLGVPAEMIERHGAVSEEVAVALADGALARFGADTAIGLTGIAGRAAARPTSRSAGSASAWSCGAMGRRNG